MKQIVCVVRICHLNIIYHFLYIYANRGLILDSYESYPVYIIEDSLQFCGGDEGDNPHVAEVREFVWILN